MSCDAESADVLRRAGHRVTSAKLLVMGALRHAGDHMTATQVIDEVQRGLPHINQSTVYRTLGSLRDARLISETYFRHGEASYEWPGEESHHHLFCDVCGTVLSLDDDLVAAFGREVAARHGFAPALDHLAVSGRCASCAARNAS